MRTVRDDAATTVTVVHDTGARPGGGAYRCVNCGYVVRVVGGARLPACLSCTRGQAETWERLGERVCASG